MAFDFQKQIYKHMCSILPKYSKESGIQAHIELPTTNIQYNKNLSKVLITLQNPLEISQQSNTRYYSIYGALIYTKILSIEPLYNSKSVKITIEGDIGIVRGTDTQDIVLNTFIAPYTYYNSIYTIQEIINPKEVILTLKDGYFDAPITLTNQGRVEGYFDNGFNGVQEMSFVNPTNITHNAPLISTGWNVDYTQAKLCYCNFYYNSQMEGTLNQLDTFFLLNPASDFITPSKDSTSIASDVSSFLSDRSHSSFIKQVLKYELNIFIKKTNIILSDSDNIVNLNFIIQSKIGGFDIDTKEIRKLYPTFTTTFLSVEGLNRIDDLESHYIFKTNILFGYSVISTDFLYNNAQYSIHLKKINVKTSKNENFSIDL